MRRAIRALITSSSYPADDKDWRGRFIADMVEALARCGTLDVLLWAPPGNSSSLVTNAARPSEAEWLRELMSRGGIAHLLRNSKIRGLIAALRLTRLLARVYKERRDVDIFHVNWLQNAIPLWGTKTPAIINVLGNDFALLKIPGMKPLLRAVIRQRCCILTPNADWMRPYLQRYFGDIAKVRTISFGIAQQWFDIKRKQSARPPWRWLVVSRLTRDKLGPLLDWGQNIFGPEHQLHLFGPNVENLDIPAWVHYHGPTHPEELIGRWFPAATGLITLSRHSEGRPQIMLEAMAAGLPIIASDIHAHKDIVQHKITGWLTGSEDDFHTAIGFFTNHENNTRIGVTARAWVAENVGTWDDCAQRYLVAYQELVENAV